MKKTLAIILCIVLLVSVGMYTFAEETKGTITVNPTVANQTYSVYKVFKLEGYDFDNNAYTYSVETAWEDFVTTGAGKNYILVTEDNGIKYVTWKDGVDEASASEFAKEALAYAKTKGITAVETKSSGDPATSVTFSNLDLGYYLVDSSLGALCALDTTKTTATVAEKNEIPTVTKTVKEGTNFGEKNDAQLGATVEFETVIHAKKGAENYVLHDKMSGLTLKGNVAVKDGNTALTAGTDYTIATNLADGCQFEITFAKAFLDTITGDKNITVTYSATVNSDAVIAGDGNSNETWLKYGDTTSTNATEKSTTKTYVWDFNIYKFANINGTETALEGAEFVLLNNAGEYAKITNGIISWENNKANATTLISDENGAIQVSGLDSGNYTLEETKAPSGYNKMDGTVAVAISDQGVVTAGGNGTTNKTVRVENKAGALLPSTGGIGTKIFYIAGGSLLVGAVVFIIVRKRMSAE